MSSLSRDRPSSASEKVRRPRDVVRRGRFFSEKSSAKAKDAGKDSSVKDTSKVEQFQENEERSLINARLRSSRSHESLLASPPSMHSIDLSAPDVEVKPLHSSVLGQGHCFHVSTAQGSKYISCTTSEERDKWLSSLRRTIRPHEEHSRRSDSSLKLWIVEAKNVSAKKRYFCEVRLDQTLYAQTSVKTMTDMLFWGEHFEFKNLPVVDIITVNLYREADKKKKKDKNTLIGYINLSISEIENRQMIEKWVTCSSGTVGKAGKETKSENPIIRLKARRQTVEILPLEAYQPFIKYLTSEYQTLCDMFEPLLNVKVKEDFATSLVHIMQKQGKAGQFLSDIVMEEISRLDDEHLTFRGNSIATKAMEAYMKLVGEKYLQDTLAEFIRQMLVSTDDCEVDPAKVGNPQILACQQKNLDMYCNMAWVKIINSFCYFPNELREVFSTLRNRCDDREKEDYSDNLISGCIFLRFLCPAILYPSLFNLTQEYPGERASRNLTLIAKTLQTLANFTQFGGKEEFMTFMNTFVEREAPNMKTFLHKISSRDAGNQFLEYDGYIDLGKELSVLHSLLLDCMGKFPETSDKKFERLSNILNTVSNAFDDPTVGLKKPNRKSQIYDNLVHVPTTARDMAQQTPNKITYGPARMKNMTASSPTEVLIDMLRHCGESADDLPALANRGRQGERTNATGEATPSTASSRGTSKDEEDSGGGGGRAVGDSWSQMVNAADSVNGDYIDLIPFMDEDVQNSSLEMEATGSQVSTVASSGYQSFSHSQSQSNSPVDPSSQGDSTREMTRELSRSPIIHYNPGQTQPLAFANPLFRHQQQQQQLQQQLRTAPASAGIRRGSGPGSLGSHQGMPISQARTMRRRSSDSSVSSEEGDGGVDADEGDVRRRQTQPVKLSAKSSSKSANSSDYHSSIAPLKKLSQLSSSSSEEDSLNMKGSASYGGGGSSGSFVHSSSSNFISPSSASYQSSSKTSSSSSGGGSGTTSHSSSLSSALGGGYNGCSTFPRYHNRQQQDKGGGGGGGNNDTSPPLPPREAIIPSTGSGTVGRSGNFHRQFSQPQAGSHSPSQGPPPPRPLPQRGGGITTNQAGHVQQRHPMQPPGGGGDPGAPRVGVAYHMTSSPAIAPRGFHSTSGSGQSSPSIHHRGSGVGNALAGGLSSPVIYRNNKTTNNSINNNNNNNVADDISGNLAVSSSSSSNNTPTNPPASGQCSSNWQVAQHVERSSSSQDTSSSSESSPQSLVRSAQHTASASSMHESSSAHSISSAPSSSQPWAYTPSHSDSNSSLSSLTKPHQRVPVRSDSSGSLGGGGGVGQVSRISQTPSDSNSSVSSGNNNSSTGGPTAVTTSGGNSIDNFASLTHARPFHSHPSPSAFQARLSSRSDSHLNTSASSLQNKPQPPPPSFLASSKYSVVHPPVPAAHGSPRSEHVASDPALNPNRPSYPPSRSMDLGYMKRASTDSTLSQPIDGLSPTGSGPTFPLPRDDSSQSVSSATGSSANRRLSPQSAVHMGISSVQRKLQEQERTKQEYEQEVHVLRQQLLEAQERLQHAELRLLDHEEDTHQLLDEWQSRLVESEEKMRRQQEEKDEQMKTIITRLQSIEEELKREHSEMSTAVEHKQQVIEVQEQRIRTLDQANNKLLQALAELKGRAAQEREGRRGSSSCNGVAGQKEVAGFKTSSC